MKNTTTTETPKRMRKQHKFFLFAEGKGLVKTTTDSGLPTFDDGEPVCFDTKAQAMFARDFFLKLKVAESIDILAKVA